ncbi:MAG TPA: NAD(P)/FAD-dependent oxidoreductase [Tepidisphaeraceae bacterium]|jgi:phytoene dehydrogenase-like protein
MNDLAADVIVIGAGLAGLNCARILSEAGRRVRIIEASDGAGGRVRTDHIDGFTLNRGFQVFLDSYPEAAAVLDYDELDLRPFNSGALIWNGQQFDALFDPRRHPRRVMSAVLSPVLTWPDRLRAMKLWADCRFGTAEDLLTRGEEKTTMAELVDRGFSAQSIDTFFRPFFGGVLLSTELTTSSRLFKYLFRMFATGRATLPAKGMQAIPDQLARRATAAGAALTLNRAAQRITNDTLMLAGGEVLRFRHCVVATDQDAAAQLLDAKAVESLAWNGEWTFYFAAHQSPLREPTLLLNGELGTGPVNDLAVLSEAAPTYAPPGQALISATVIGRLDETEETLERDIRLHMAHWFGTAVIDWRFLRAYRIPRALPDQTPPQSTTPKPVIVRSGVYVCGDHREQASIQGALVAGRRAAEAVLKN